MSPAPTQIYTLSLHDALPILAMNSPTTSSRRRSARCATRATTSRPCSGVFPASIRCAARSEEHTSELQSLTNLVCRLLLEKKKKQVIRSTQHDTSATTKSANL